MIQETLQLVLSLSGRKPARAMPRRLDKLFRRLAETRDGMEAQETEDLIWGLWMTHPDRDAEERLERATRALAARDLDAAETLLDRLVHDYPEFAEAWNKRATLYFLQGRDAESVADIRRTLSLEPRHFGALAGFGQICLRQGDRVAALFAFDAALAVNPHLAAVRAMAAELSAEGAKTVH